MIIRTRSILVSPPPLWKKKVKTYRMSHSSNLIIWSKPSESTINRESSPIKFDLGKGNAHTWASSKAISFWRFALSTPLLFPPRPFLVLDDCNSSMLTPFVPKRRLARSSKVPPHFILKACRADLRRSRPNDISSSGDEKADKSKWAPVYNELRDNAIIVTCIKHTGLTGLNFSFQLHLALHVTHSWHSVKSNYFWLSRLPRSFWGQFFKWEIVCKELRDLIIVKYFDIISSRYTSRILCYIKQLLDEVESICKILGVREKIWTRRQPS